MCVDSLLCKVRLSLGGLCVHVPIVERSFVLCWCHCRDKKKTRGFTPLRFLMPVRGGKNLCEKNKYYLKSHRHSQVPSQYHFLSLHECSVGVQQSMFQQVLGGIGRSVLIDFTDDFKYLCTAWQRKVSWPADLARGPRSLLILELGL